MNPPGLSSLSLEFNSLFASDPALLAWLDTNASNWEDYQTVEPTNFTVTGVVNNTVSFSWDPILYTTDTGFYEILYSTSSGGPYTPFTMVTADKSVAALTVTDLDPFTTYYFVVRTQTNSHMWQPNTVVSSYSGEVSATTFDALAETGQFVYGYVLMGILMISGVFLINRKSHQTFF
jgi:LPXTG-motif cell wall-anchored protein